MSSFDKSVISTVSVAKWQRCHQSFSYLSYFCRLAAASWRPLRRVTGCNCFSLDVFSRCTKPAVVLTTILLCLLCAGGENLPRFLFWPTIKSAMPNSAA